MAGRLKRVGPLALTTTPTTNIYVPGSALIEEEIFQIHVVNKTAASATFSLWIGATGANAAGTEVFNQEPVGAHASFDRFVNWKMLSTDFLVGGSDTATALSITLGVRQYVV